MWDRNGLRMPGPRVQLREMATTQVPSWASNTLKDLAKVLQILRALTLFR